MKSKISFFNRTVFWKNVTLFWPIWGLYLVALLLLVPGNLWLHFKAYPAAGTGDLQALYSSLNLTVDMVGIMIMAAVTGVALHNYLFVARSANMLHALPVSRLELFGTNLVSGLGFMLLPQVIAFLAGVLVCLGNGQTNVQYLGSWLLVMMGVTVIMYSMVEFCAMITGQIWALPLFYLILNSAYLVLQFVAEAVVIAFCDGVIGFSTLSTGKWEWLSPAYYLLDSVGFVPQYELAGRNSSDGTSVCSGMTLEGGRLIARYLILALFFYLGAWWFYRKRHLEKAGDLITVNFVKPIFRWGVGFVMGFLAALLGREFLQELGYERSTYVLVGMAVVSGGIFFCFADMLIKKTFRVFKKQMLAEWAAFLLAMLLAGFGMQHYGRALMRFVPEESDVAAAILEFHYPIPYGGEDISRITKLHEAVIEQNGEPAEDEGGHYLSITYEMKDGSLVQRFFAVSDSGRQKEVYDFLLEEELKTDNFLKCLLMEDYDNMELYTGGLLGSETEYDFDMPEFGKDEARRLVKAFIADAEAGALQKYNIYMGEEYGGVYSDRYISINYSYPASAEAGESELYYDGNFTDGIWDRLAGYDSLWPDYVYAEYGESIIYFGEDCTHVLEALEEMGLIQDR